MTLFRNAKSRGVAALYKNAELASVAGLIEMLRDRAKTPKFVALLETPRGLAFLPKHATPRMVGISPSFSYFSFIYEVKQR